MSGIPLMPPPRISMISTVYFSFPRLSLTVENNLPGLRLPMSSDPGSGKE